MKKANILLLANNIDGNVDGIGKHAKMIAEEMRKRDCISNVVVESGNTENMSSVEKIFSFEMFKAFLRAGQRIMHHEFKAVIIEYPFSEYNPIILLGYLYLCILCRIRRIKYILSMHEYDRLNILRRLVVRFFLFFCDKVYVSEDKYFKSLKKYSSKMYLRLIPNHFVCIPEQKYINRKRFCYMGLVNSSKAFSQMLNAWDVFNSNREFQLDIISGTKLNLDFCSNNNVKYYYNLPNEDAVKLMHYSTFAIVPVLPNIGYNNSSFVSVIQSGCIPLGVFSDVLVNEDFIINCKSYDLDDLLSALSQSVTLSNECLLEMSKKAVFFGRNFSIEKTVDQMLVPILSD